MYIICILELVILKDWYDQEMQRARNKSFCHNI
jgi:hypothetical protein